jgi:hypothetical protein
MSLYITIFAFISRIYTGSDVNVVYKRENKI